MAQSNNLLSTGHPQHLQATVARDLLEELKRGDQYCPEIRRRKEKNVVVPYMRRVAHTIRKIGMRGCVEVILSGPNKLAKLCPMVNGGGREKVGCSKKHREQFDQCEEGVICSLPLESGKTYVSQTSGCLKDRLREHKILVGKTVVSGHLAAKIVTAFRCSGRAQ